jgi:hypothetical protein
MGPWGEGRTQGGAVWLRDFVESEPGSEEGFAAGEAGFFDAEDLVHCILSAARIHKSERLRYSTREGYTDET